VCVCVCCPFHLIMVNSGGGGGYLPFAYSWGVAAEPAFEFGEAKLEVSSESGSTGSYSAATNIWHKWSIAGRHMKLEGCTEGGTIIILEKTRFLFEKRPPLRFFPT
jgi:hypothetical protein